MAPTWAVPGLFLKLRLSEHTQQLAKFENGLKQLVVLYCFCLPARQKQASGV